MNVASELRALLEYAILAPSSHNSQPWLFALGAEHIDLHADRARALPVVDPDDRELVMSCGAALFHLRAAARRFGFAPDVTTFPRPDEPDLLARLRLGPRRAASLEDIALFDAMPRRHTSRHVFAEAPLPLDLIGELTRAAAEEGCWLHLVTPEERIVVADLTAEGDRQQARNPSFRRELAAWMHTNRSRSHDGMPGYALGMGDVASLIGPLIVRTFDWGKGRAAKDRELAAGAPALLVLGSASDEPAAWLTAGQALARVLLRATVEGVSASFLNQAIEVDWLRVRLREHLLLPTAPQIILRLGYGPSDVRPTPRRAVAEVLRPFITG